MGLFELQEPLCGEECTTQIANVLQMNESILMMIMEGDEAWFHCLARIVIITCVNSL